MTFIQPVDRYRSTPDFSFIGRGAENERFERKSSAWDMSRASGLLLDRNAWAVSSIPEAFVETEDVSNVQVGASEMISALALSGDSVVLDAVDVRTGRIIAIAGIILAAYFLILAALADVGYAIPGSFLLAVFVGLAFYKRAT